MQYHVIGFLICNKSSLVIFYHFAFYNYLSYCLQLSLIKLIELEFLESVQHSVFNVVHSFVYITLLNTQMNKEVLKIKKAAPLREQPVQKKLYQLYYFIPNAARLNPVTVKPLLTPPKN